MSDSAVGVVGDVAVANRLRKAGASVVVGTTETVPSTDRLVAVGQSALSAVAAAEGDPLVVPVDAGRGVRSVAPESVPAVVASLSGARVERHPVVEVTVADSTVGTAVWDVTLVTAEAARISEYIVETPTEPIGQFRADGVTVALPAGSTEYARRVGGAVLTPGNGVCVVAPIAPFQTNPDHWVIPMAGLTVTVARDEATVSLYVDGEELATVGVDDSVSVERTGTMRVAVATESRSRFV